MTITTMDLLVASLPGQRRPYMKYVSPQAISGFESLWTRIGVPGAGVAPGSVAGVVPTSSTAGAISFTNPGGGITSYLANLNLADTTAGVFYLYDRLVHTDGLSGTVTSAQTINSTAITRPSSTGTDVECFLEVYTALGATTRTATISYTNSAGTSGQTSGAVTIPATMAAGRCLPFPLASGDAGVRSVQSLTLSGSTLTAGNFGITLARRVTMLSLPDSPGGFGLDAFDLGMPTINDSSCLYGIWFASSATANQIINGQAQIVQG